MAQRRGGVRRPFAVPVRIRGPVMAVRGRAARSLVACAWVLVAASACVAGVATDGTGGEPAELQAAIDAYVQRVRAGEPEPVGEEAWRRRLEGDRALLRRLRAIDPEHLERAERIDRAALIGVLATDVLVAEARRPWERDPTTYLPAERLGRAFDAVQAGEAEARERLAELLGALPARLEAGMAALTRPPRRFTEEAIFQAEQTAAALARWSEQEHATGIPRAVLAAARDALGRWQGFLRQQLLPRSDGDWRLGRETYEAVLRRRWFLDATPEEILRRGQEAFARTEQQAQQVAERLWPGHDWVDAYERLKDDHPPADGIKAAYQQAMDAARAFVHERRVVTLPERERVITVDTPPAMRRSSPFGTFDTVEPFGDGLVGRLVLTPIERWLSPEQRAERLRSHHRAWIPIIAVHEAYPGHHAHAIKARESPRPLRRVLQEPITLEGWGLFTEQLMFELGFLRGDDVRLTMLRNRLWRAARVILDVSLHTGRMQVDEAVDFLVDRVRFERYAAELEVGMYPRRPTYVLGYLVGMQEIDALRRDWIAAHGEPDPPAALWDAFLSAGGIPPALIRAELLGGPIPGE